MNVLKMYSFFLQEIRKICDDFSSKGLPNFPSGVPFTFYEQYINLRFYLMLSLICVLVVTFVVLTVVLMNPWIAAIVVRSSSSSIISTLLIKHCIKKCLSLVNCIVI